MSEALININNLNFSYVPGEPVLTDAQTADEVGELSRDVQQVLRDLARYTAFLERIPRTLRHELSNPMSTVQTSLELLSDEKDPEQQAYDEITARYPALYQYPPCYDIRVSSSNLRGELMRKNEINVATIDALAAQCGESFCFGLVGNKIAAVCP